MARKLSVYMGGDPADMPYFVDDVVHRLAEIHPHETNYATADSWSSWVVTIGQQSYLVHTARITLFDEGDNPHRRTMALRAHLLPDEKREEICRFDQQFREVVPIKHGTPEYGTVRRASHCRHAIPAAAFGGPLPNALADDPGLAQVLSAIAKETKGAHCLGATLYDEYHRRPDGPVR